MRRVAAFVALLWATLTVVFLLVQVVPGDPVDAVIGQSAVSPETRARITRDLGLDRPVWQQYLIFLSNAARLDFGASWASQQSVSLLIRQNLIPTLSLAVASLMVALCVAFPLAFADHPLSALTITFLYSTPTVALGILLMWVFAVQWGFFPATGQGTLATLILPASTLGLQSAGFIGKALQSERHTPAYRRISEGLRMAGLSPWSRFRLELPIALLVTSEIIALQFAFLLGGTVLVEVLFARSGLGGLLVDATLAKDIPVILGVMVVIVCVVGGALQLGALFRRLGDPT